MKIAVAMSGGVDSSVAAFLMVKKYGKENVFGVTARLFCYSHQAKEKACCSLEAIDDAKAVCKKLGISHYVINEEAEFEKAVIKNFIESYRHGQTPIPCIPCNTNIKFGSMLEKVKKLGAEKLATGHYARIKMQNSNNKKQIKRYQLLRGVDSEKDQTYFLYGLNQNQLSQIEFPIGGLKKIEVRKLAKEIELKIAEKKESQGVCFVMEGRVTDFLADKIKSKKGNIINSKGEVLGNHEGYVFYTIGQRKRIGGGHNEPMFVIRIDPLKNEVIIGNKDELYRSELVFNQPNWIDKVKFPLKCSAKIRYNMEDTSCVVRHQATSTKQQEISNFKFQISNYVVTFKKPQRAITPGQSIVFYDGEICLGGGIIS